MIHADLNIIHSLPGRMRLQLSLGLSSPDLAQKFMAGQPKITAFSYNQRLKTALICYEDLEFSEVLAPIAIIYARQNNLQYVHISNLAKQSGPQMATSGKIALASIIINAAIQHLGPLFGLNSPSISAISKWCALGTTAGAVIEHGYHELTERGSFDPEVMAIIYLANAMSRGQTNLAIPLVWLIVFGRHLFPAKDKGLIIKIEKQNNNPNYAVRLLNEKASNKKIDFFDQVVDKYLSQNVYMMGRNFMENSNQNLFRSRLAK